MQDIRDRLIAKIGSLEADENGDLTSRVRTFAATKDELEKRVATVSPNNFPTWRRSAAIFPAFSTNYRTSPMRHRTDPAAFLHC